MQAKRGTSPSGRSERKKRTSKHDSQQKQQRRRKVRAGVKKGRTQLPKGRERKHAQRKKKHTHTNTHTLKHRGGTHCHQPSQRNDRSNKGHGVYRTANWVFSLLYDLRQQTGVELSRHLDTCSGRMRDERSSGVGRGGSGPNFCFW